MSAPSPADIGGLVPSYAIKANGKLLDGRFQVASIETWNAVDRIPRARLVLVDSDPSGGALASCSSEVLTPGAKLEVALGYTSKETTVFSGLVRRQALRAERESPLRLVIEASGLALGMTLTRSNAVKVDVTDNQVCEALIRRAGLKPQVDGTGARHERMIQYYASDWDMLVMRAQANGMVVIADQDRVAVTQPDLLASPVLTLTYGESILGLNLELDAATQVPRVESHALISGGKDQVKASNPTPAFARPGGPDASNLAKALGVKAVRQQAAGGLTSQALADWSKADQMRRGLAEVRGHVRFQGSSLARVGALVGLQGLGKSFNGLAFVSSVSHLLADGAWTTTIGIGLEPAWFAVTAPAIAAPEASGQLPPIPGLQIGVVKQLDKDPAGEGRILVTMPLMEDAVGVWARRGPFTGALKVTDEVALAFLNGDPRYPVVLGALYSKSNPAP